MSDEPAPPDDDLPPLSRAELKALFDHLDRQLCDHDHAHTRQFLRGRGLPAGPVIDWLRRHGSGCDCEAVLNTDGAWGEWAGRLPPTGDDV